MRDRVVTTRIWGGACGQLLGQRALPVGEPVVFQNPATGLELRFQAAAEYSLISPPRIGRRWIVVRAQHTAVSPIRGSPERSDPGIALAGQPFPASPTPFPGTA